MKKRKEFDSIGAINVPADKYWGASTERSNKFFNIGKILVNSSIIRSIAIIKRSAAIVHKKEKLVPANISSAIVKASNEVISGKLENNKGINVSNRNIKLDYLTIKDLEEYDAKEREPICQFIFSYQMCGMPPPSSGGTSVLSILRILEYLSKDGFFNLNSKIEDNPLLAHLFIEASRLAFIDRNTFIADPDFVNVPIKNMLGKKYLESRAKLISKKKILTDLHPGKFFSNQTNPISAVSPEDASTSHLSIVDSYGNIVSLTSSIETAFGSRLMVDGFLLNNQLTDFSFNPIDTSGGLVSNRVEGNKRPRSSMSPMIIFNKDGKPLLVLGSPGGKRIIPYVAGLILDVLIMSRDAQDSLYRPHIFQVDDRAEVEVGTSKHIVEELRSIGHDPIIRDQTSGLHVIQYKDNKLIGLAWVMPEPQNFIGSV